MSSFLSSAGYERSPAISPDGRQVAFTSLRTGSAAIWIANQDGSGERQLIALGSGGAPRWSPDGGEIAFDAVTKGNLDVYVIPASGGSPRRMTTDPGSDAVPSWSRDGNWLYFASNREGGKHQIWKMPAHGSSAAVRVTKDGGFVASESVDGRFLYFAKATRMPPTAGERSLWRVPTAGGNEEMLIAGLTDLRAFAVSPQGIYYERETARREFELCFYRFATGSSERLMSIQKRGFEGLSVSPDGRWALFSDFEEKGGDLWLVENFR